MSEQLRLEALDTQTIERLADLIVGDDRNKMPKYRSGYQLDLLFGDAGIERLSHDGSARRAWTVEALRSCVPEEMGRLILRLASPKEYGGARQLHSRALSSLNQILSIEGVKIIMNGMEPALLPEEPAFIDVEEMNDISPSMEVPDFQHLGFNSQMAQLLSNRWFEAETCFSDGAYLSTMIMLGSLIESVLFNSLIRNQQVVAERGIVVKDKAGLPLPIQRWSLFDMINVSTKLGWIKSQLSTFSHALREYRNLVHPEAQLRTGIVPSSEDCRIASIILAGMVCDLRNVEHPTGQDVSLA